MPRLMECRGCNKENIDFGLVTWILETGVTNDDWQTGLIPIEPFPVSYYVDEWYETQTAMIMIGMNTNRTYASLHRKYYRWREEKP